MTSLRSNMLRFITITELFFSLVVFTGCGNGEAPSDDDDTDETEMTEWEQEHGFGPITEPVQISDAIDEDLAALGHDVFELRCESCHRIDSELVGPAMRGVFQGRSPEWIMNFTLNPRENIQDHPLGQSLMQQYLVEMPYQGVSEEEARAIVEYLRAEVEES